MALSARQGAVRCASDEWRSRSQVGAQVVSAAPSSLSQVLVRVNGRTICIDAQFDRNGDPAPAERYLTLALQKAYSSSICRKSSHTGSTSSCSATLSSSLTRRTPGRSLSESTCSTSALTPRSSPWQLWSSDSGFMEPGDPVRPGAWVEARLRHGLRGGKGGFGNTLRASARRGGTGTTDFSACRDLSGRRLRHVNNEIRLRHWREEQADRARERDGNVNEDDQTHRVAPKTTSGIKNWFLPVPSWADSVPKGKKNADPGPKVVGRGRRLCQDWARARVFSNLKAAADAPVWIGCPRGRSCPFSHREDELTPAKRADIVSEKRKSDRAAVDDKMREFVTQMQETESTMQSSILEGLRRSKQASVQLKAKAKANAQSMEDDVNQDLEDTSTNDTDRIQCLCGDIDVGEFGEVLGRTKFSTAIVPAVAVTDESWYFEVTLLADPAGSLQIGCATELFEALEHSEDGVGDLPFSWALDPIRGKFFNQGAELDAMFNNELLKDADVVKSGCTIGCHLDVCKRQIYFSINGSRVSIAGKSVYEPLFLTSRFMRRSSSLSSSSSISSTQTASSGIGADSHFFYPAISMDEGSFVRINLGERPFQCVPLDRRVHGLCGDSNLRLLCSDSSFASDKGAIAADSMAFSKVHIQPEMPGDDYKPVDLDAVESVKELEALGLGALKQELDSRNLKCGGTLEERAARLFSVKGLAPEDIDLSLRPKRKKRRIV